VDQARSFRRAITDQNLPMGASMFLSTGAPAPNAAQQEPIHRLSALWYALFCCPVRIDASATSSSNHMLYLVSHFADWVHNLWAWLHWLPVIDYG
jgi:hypothetical protein